MTASLAPRTFQVKSHSVPDEVQTPSRVRIEVVELDGLKIRRFHLEPGWLWTGCIRRRAAIERSQLSHLGYALSGRLTVRTTDGIEKTIVAGDSYSLPREHDAWVEGDQPFVA